MCADVRTEGRTVCRWPWGGRWEHLTGGLWWDLVSWQKAGSRETSLPPGPRTVLALRRGLSSSRRRSGLLCSAQKQAVLTGKIRIS